MVPLKTSETTQSRPPRPHQRPRDLHAFALELEQTGTLPIDESSHINSNDGSTHRKNGVQIRLMQKLKRGHFKPVDQLDLHNMSTTQGRRALLEFISDSIGQTPACIRIIHGKGLRSGQGPRLRDMTRQLLREHPGVLAFSTCKPAHGGEGATDVLLRTS